MWTSNKRENPFQTRAKKGRKQQEKREKKKKRAQSWAEVLTLLLHHKDCHG